MTPTERGSIDRPVALILLIGMLASIVLMLVGVVLLLARLGPHGVKLLPPVHALTQALSFDPAGWLSLGLFVLILTPVARVAVAIVSFAWIRDWRYALVSVLVLAAMLAGLVLGRG